MLNTISQENKDLKANDEKNGCEIVFDLVSLQETSNTTNHSNYFKPNAAVSYHS